MTNNELKQELAGLQKRVELLELNFTDIANGIMLRSEKIYSCSICGACDPIDQGYVCNVADCCMGLNPNDK